MTAVVTDRALEGVKALELNPAERLELQRVLSILDVATSPSDLSSGGRLILVDEVDGSKIYLIDRKSLELVVTLDPSGNYVVAQVRRKSRESRPKGTPNEYGFSDETNPFIPIG